MGKDSNFPEKTRIFSHIFHTTPQKSRSSNRINNNFDKWYYKESENELLLWDGKYRILAFVEDTLLVQMFNHIDILVNLGEEFPQKPINRAKDHFDKNNIIRLLKQGNIPDDTIEKYVR